MAGEKHINTSPQANENTASWFQKLMRISIWEKENTESKKVAGKGLPGHRDPTADAAIANVIREEKRKAKDKDREAENRNANNRKENDGKEGEENA